MKLSGGDLALVGAAVVAVGAWSVGYGMGYEACRADIEAARPVRPEDFSDGRDNGRDCTRNGKPVRCDKGLDP